MTGTSQEYMDYMSSLQEDIKNGLAGIRQSADEIQKAVSSMRRSLDDFKFDEQQRILKESARQSALTQKSNEEMDDDENWDYLEELKKQSRNE